MTALARLFGSLANTLLDLGLPRIRAWLRERVGPGADVAQVSTEGSFIHLDGVRLPIGARGELVLERATAAITSARSAGSARGGLLPEVRLHAFRGVLRFSDGDVAAGGELQADVVFTASPQTDEAAWVSGELTIVRASWSARAPRDHLPAQAGAPAPAHAPMEGRARLLVTSTAWTLDEGFLSSEHANVRFAGRGATGAADADADGTQASGGGAIHAATLALDGARVGPFVDAVQAMVGRALDVPPGVPLDARLTGDLAWDAAAGGTCKLHVTAEGLEADLTGKVAADGKGLAAQITGELAPVVPMRKADVSTALLPRDEDRLRIEIEVKGDVSKPDIRATLRAPQMGFRFGRPRFQPLLVVRDIAIDVVADVGADVAKVEARAGVGQGTLSVLGDVSLKTSEHRRLQVNLADIEPAWVTSLTTALAPAVHLVVEGEAPSRDRTDAVFTLPRDARIGCDVSVMLAGPIALDGELIVTTPRSRLKLSPIALRSSVVDASLVGSLAFADALTLGLFPFEIRPEPTGAASLDLALRGPIDDLVLAGRLTSPSLRIAITSRPEVPSFLLDEVTTSISIDRRSFSYADGRFNAYGGAFHAEGRIPFSPVPVPVPDLSSAPASAPLSPAPPRLLLQCRDATASFVEALASLANGRLRVRAEGDGSRARPADELWIPRSCHVSGEIRLGADMTTNADVALETAAGSALLTTFVLSPDLRVDGTTIRGTLAIADALVAGAFDTSIRPLPEGVARIDATLKGPIDDCALSGFATVETLRVALHEGGRMAPSAPVFVVTELTTLFRMDTAKIIWHRLDARIYGGTLTSAGVIGHGGAFIGLQSTIAARNVAVEQLPTDDRGARLGVVARGQLTVEMRFDRIGADGPVTGRGHAQLDHGAFPVLERSRPALGRYGLAPPPEHATGPATVNIALDHAGWSFLQARGTVPGCEATGDVRVGFDASLEGALVVTLGEELLASSAVLVVPSILAERLTVPVRIGGTLGRPRVHADLGACLGRFVTDNRVTALFSEAASDVVSLLTGREPPRPAPPARGPVDVASAAKRDHRSEDELLRELVASGVDWDEIEERLEEHRRGGVRHRIG